MGWAGTPARATAVLRASWHMWGAQEKPMSGTTRHACSQPPLGSPDYSPNYRGRPLNSQARRRMCSSAA
eukprot:677497-Pyramimonas_sp.AAC.1